MKAVLTLDNGEKFIADIYPLQGKKQHKPRFHDEYERWFVEEFNPNRSLENFASILSQNRVKITYYVSIKIL